MSLGLAEAMRDRGDRRPWASGTVVSIDPATQRMAVNVDGGRASLPYAPGQYGVGDTVAIVRDPYRTGAGQFVVARIGTSARSVPPSAVGAHPGIVAAHMLVTCEAVVLPVWTGTWRTRFGGYGLWNDTVAATGGAGTLYQGQAGDSGPLVGVAVYGRQVADLGAHDIQSITVDVTRVAGNGIPVLQASAQHDPPTGPPAPSGGQVFGTGAVDLAVLAEGFRTGAVGGLVAVGSGHAGILGTSHGAGMALRIRYRKRA